jgi:hypothetical protein
MGGMAIENLADKIIELTEAHQQKKFVDGLRRTERRNFGGVMRNCQEGSPLMNLVPEKWSRTLSESDRFIDNVTAGLKIPLLGDVRMVMGQVRSGEERGVGLRFLEADGCRKVQDVWVTPKNDHVFFLGTWTKIRPENAGAKFLARLDLREDVDWGKVTPGSTEEKVLHEMGFDRPEVGSSKVEKYLAAKVVGVAGAHD